MTRIEIPNGTKFGRLTVTEELSPRIRNGKAYRLFLCECDCGERIEALLCNLRTGKSTSCGCLKIERAVEARRTHGLSQTPEYSVWADMLVRCHNPNHKHFARYGGRGIKVCDRWRNSCQAFISDVGTRPSRLHTLDRINNDGDYEPSNVRWATQKQQCRNTSRNVLLTFNGETRCIAEWSEVTGINRVTIADRLRRKLPVEAVLTNHDSA
jgi:hypothetical protein